MLNDSNSPDSSSWSILSFPSVHSTPPDTISASSKEGRLGETFARQSFFPFLYPLRYPYLLLTPCIFAFPSLRPRRPQLSSFVCDTSIPSLSLPCSTTCVRVQLYSFVKGTDALRPSFVIPKHPTYFRPNSTAVRRWDPHMLAFPYSSFNSFHLVADSCPSQLSNFP